VLGVSGWIAGDPGFPPSRERRLRGCERLHLEAWNDLVPGVNWKEMLTEGDDKETVAALRLNAQTGRPRASDSFLSKFEHTLGRRLRPCQSVSPRKRQPRHGKGANRWLSRMALR
jgi:hypothetical protein